MKRITIAVDDTMDEIKDRILANTGIKMSYVQIVNYLIRFYIKNATDAKTTWRPL
jgi:hypothetical protein